MSEKLWAGRFSKALSEEANDYNASIRFDRRMSREDLLGSIAHAMMLGATDIITAEEAALIVKGLEWILEDI